MKRYSATSRELRIDLDGRRLPLRVLMERLARANRRIVALGERQSPSGRGWHQWIHVRPAPRSAQEIVMLQLLLGSDPLREAYNMVRARAVDERKVSRYWRVRDRWNVLYLWSRRWKVAE